MTESYRALCSDFYVNQKLAVKMELPRGRETVLELFERARKQFPAMNQFRRFRDELALESPQSEAPHRWLAVRSSTVRTGSVNPPSSNDAYSLHRHILEVAPYFLNISPLDVDYLELLYGFDLIAPGNHDAIVFDALIASTPLGRLSDISGASPSDMQPMLGFTIGEQSQTEVYFEIKTRAEQASRDGEPGSDPISVYLTLRRFGPFGDVKDLPVALQELSTLGEDLVESKVVPAFLVPLRDAIGSGNG